MAAPTATSVQSPDSRDRLVTPAFVRLAMADLAYFTATGVSIYALPLYVTGPVGSDKAGAGLAFGAFAVSAFVLRPFAGRFSDVWGRRPLLLGGALLCSAAMLLTASVDTLPLVVALRLVLGVAEAAFFVAGSPRSPTSRRRAGWARPSATPPSASISGWRWAHRSVSCW